MHVAKGNFSKKIIKTDKIFKKASNNLVRKFGTIYAIFNNIGRYHDLKEDRFDVNFFDCLFGK